MEEQLKEFLKLPLCDCECHTSEKSSYDVRLCGCESCKKYNHPDARQGFLKCMEKIREEAIQKLAEDIHKRRMSADKEKNDLDLYYLHEIDMKLQKLLHSFK